MDIQKSTEIPEVQKTIVMLRTLSADEKTRQEVYYREKRLHDEASALYSARAEGLAEGRAKGRTDRDNELIEKWRKKGFTEEQIKELLS
ncbi:MAG: hypothetical protein K6B74_02210 [Ruminococcus sp.]|nr:hypothetical protein [Ruminococcus sp.]